MSIDAIEKLKVAAGGSSAIQHVTMCSTEPGNTWTCAYYVLSYGFNFDTSEASKARRNMKRSLFGPFSTMDGIDAFADEVEASLVSIVHRQHSIFNSKTGERHPFFEELTNDQTKRFGDQLRSFGKAWNAGLYDQHFPRDTELTITIFSGVYHKAPLSEFYDAEHKSIRLIPMQTITKLTFQMDDAKGDPVDIDDIIFEGVKKIIAMEQPPVA